MMLLLALASCLTVGAAGPSRIDSSPRQLGEPLSSPLSSVLGGLSSTVTGLIVSQLNASVGGRLAFSYPIAQPCFSRFSGSLNNPHNNPAACSAAEQGWKSDAFQASQFGGYPTPTWSACPSKNQGCLLDFEDPANPAAFAPPETCYQGSIPPVYVNVQAVPQDIQAAFVFAKTHGVRLVIKNSGHDYKGRSSGPDSLGLWTHNLVDKSFSPAFVASGCAASTAREAVTLGAGMSAIAALEYVDSLDRTIVAGAARTVGISGGYVAGGGHSAVSNVLGLAVDNALQFKVVTPDGNFRTVSRCANSDLFFALAGGGGSTFGVVTETTFALHPKKTTQATFIAFTAPSSAAVQNFLSVVVDNALRWVQEGSGGYVNVNPVPGSLNSMIFLNSNQTIEQTRASMKPLTDYVTSLGASVLANQISTVDSFFDAFQTFIIGLSLTAASRLVQASNLDTPSALAATQQAMQSVLGAIYPLEPTRPVYGAPIQMLFSSPFNTPATGGTSETPAWRSAVWHSVHTAATYWNSTTEQVVAANAQVVKATNFLRAITPNSGTYISEADLNEPNYQKAFWGTENYAKLLKIKAKYDPSNLLTCWQCVGWNQADSRFACYR